MGRRGNADNLSEPSRLLTLLRNNGHGGPDLQSVPVTL